MKNKKYSDSEMKLVWSHTQFDYFFFFGKNFTSTPTEAKNKDDFFWNKNEVTACHL